MQMNKGSTALVMIFYFHYIFVNNLLKLGNFLFIMGSGHDVLIKAIFPSWT